MYPHERSLVKRLEGKPFALLGVNSDPDKEKLKPRLQEEKITWRSFWNGPDGTQGSIAKAWNVRGWPTLYYLDHKGIIRAKNLHQEQQIDKLLNELIAECEKDSKKQ
jgi:hypothetical protein